MCISPPPSKKAPRPNAEPPPVCGPIVAARGGGNLRANFYPAILSLRPPARYIRGPAVRGFFAPLVTQLDNRMIYRPCYYRPAGRIIARQSLKVKTISFCPLPAIPAARPDLEPAQGRGQLGRTCGHKRPLGGWTRGDSLGPNRPGNRHVGAHVTCRPGGRRRWRRRLRSLVGGLCSSQTTSVVVNRRHLRQSPSPTDMILSATLPGISGRPGSDRTPRPIPT